MSSGVVALLCHVSMTDCSCTCTVLYLFKMGRISSNLYSSCVRKLCSSHFRSQMLLEEARGHGSLVHVYIHMPHVVSSQVLHLVSDVAFSHKQACSCPFCVHEGWLNSSSHKDSGPFIICVCRRMICWYIGHPVLSDLSV